MPFYTPLRYPGGKRKLINFLKAFLRENDLVGCSYAEPYAGGAGLALGLLFEQLAGHILINDLNPSIFSFWNAVLNHTENFCRLIRDTPVTMKQWERQKEVQKYAGDLCGSLELGFSTFFLNRTNRSGILKGGVIGGKAQDGEWKLGERFQKYKLIQRIERIAQRRKQITLSQEDALVFLEKNGFSRGASPCLIYMDPPYYRKGAGLYDNFYEDEDHIRLAGFTKKLLVPWIISYDNVPQIRELYQERKGITYSLHYTAQDKSQGSEYMAISDSLRFPQDGEENTSYGCMRNLTKAS